MRKNRYQKITIASVFLPLIQIFFPTSSAFAADIPIGKTIKNVFNLTAQKAGFAEKGSEFKDEAFLTFFGVYINGIFGFIGLVFLIWIILGGWWWMTSQGNEERIMKAKKTILHSAIGIGIILFAMVITNVILTIIEESLKAA